MIIPFWIYFVVAGIVFSAFMAVKTAKIEAELEREQIESEGEVYMRRLQDEKERKRMSIQEGNS